MAVVTVGQQLLIGRIGFLGRGVCGAVGAVIDERAHRHARQELRETANVVSMIVGQQQIIDLAHARVFGRGGNAAGIESVVPCPSGIDQQRLSCGGDKERRLTTVDVDEVDLQIMARGSREMPTAKYEPGQNDCQQRLRL